MKSVVLVVVTSQLLSEDMPSPSAFKRAFGLDDIRGLRRVTIGHICAKRYEDYRFPLTLEFTSELSPALIRSRIRGQTSKRRLVVYSSYGSPYTCVIGPWKVKGHTATAEGKAIRTREIPTQRRAAQNVTRGKDIFLALSAEQKEGYRFVKSAYATSHCRACRRPILPGERICRPVAQRERGGWGHVNCVFGGAFE